MPKSISLISLFYVLLPIFFSCNTQKPGDKNKSGIRTASSKRSWKPDKKLKKNILQIVQSSPDHTILASAVKASGLNDALMGVDPITLFAPTNSAFENMKPGTLDTLSRPENRQKLASIITSHMSPGIHRTDTLKQDSKLYMTTGHEVNILIKNGTPYVKGAKILSTIKAENGIFHSIDAVLMIVTRK